MTRTITLILLLGLLSCCSSGKDDDARKGGGGKSDPDAVGLTLSQQSKTIPENIFGYNTQSFRKDSVFVGKEKRRKEQVSSSQIFDSLFCICSEQ